MSETKSIRIDRGLYDSAEYEGKSESRSVVGQIEYWSRVGRAVGKSTLPQYVVKDLLRDENYYDLKPEDAEVVDDLLWDSFSLLDGEVDEELMSEQTQDQHG